MFKKHLSLIGSLWFCIGVLFIINVAIIIFGLNLITLPNPNGYHYEYAPQTHKIVKQASKTITYQIDADPSTAGVWQGAIQAYQKLGVIKFKYTNHHPDILLLGRQNNPHQQKDINGWTAYDNHHNIFKLTDTMTNTQCGVSKNFDQLDGLQQMAVCEHELGHALGLGHDNRMAYGGYYIMNGYTKSSYHLLGTHEKQALEHLYN